MPEEIMMDESNEIGGYVILAYREDGTFTILKDGSPYHACPEYCPEIWAAINAQLGIVPKVEA
jgi:hypothetical protein